MNSEFGIIGLGVMGKSLARNFAKHGFKLSLYNRHVDNTEEDVAKNFIANYSELSTFKGFDSLKKFVESIETPRKILIMVNAGHAIDSVIADLLNYIEPDDIIIDGGNSHYKKTAERSKFLWNYKIDLIGMGVSGGEEGALHGPSLMPGGHKEAFEKVASYEGAGHFVKMVHNGIEYVEMQLIAEVYSILRFNNGLEPDAISEVFNNWNETTLQNYLLQSTAVILKTKEGDVPLIDLILDKASHKGTGSWTSIAAAELGVPFTLCNAALNARYVSSLKDARTSLSKDYTFNKKETESIDLESLKHAYQTARILNHYQGLQLITEASKTYNWDINLKHVTSVWTSGCIIASEFMYTLVSLLQKTDSILETNSISEYILKHQSSLKQVVIESLKSNIPIPCLSESINFLHAITQASGTGNIIQAQRDYFGAHTYKRNDDDGKKNHHTNWNNN